MADDVTQAVETETQAVDGDVAEVLDGQEPDGASETMSLAEVRKLRREAQNLRKRLAEAEKADADRKQAELTEAEKIKQGAAKAQQELAELRKAHQETVIRYEVMLQASALNVVDPDAAVRLLDLEAIEADEAGKIDKAAVETALKALLKQKPYLVKAEQKPAPETNARNGRNREADDAAKAEELKRRYRLNG